jgi:hypothetical protein
MDGSHQYYDGDKYVELVLDIAETVLGVLGFSRKKLGFGSLNVSYIFQIGGALKHTINFRAEFN